MRIGDMPQSMVEELARDRLVFGVSYCYWSHNHDLWVRVPPGAMLVSASQSAHLGLAERVEELEHERDALVAERDEALEELQIALCRVEALESQLEIAGVETTPATEH